MGARRKLASLALALAASTCVLTVASVGPAQAEDPIGGTEAVALPPFAPPGTLVQVRGQNWPPKALINVALCGNNFLNGASDCAPTSGNTTTANDDGRFFTEIQVSLPPKPCPCVVHVSTPEATVTVDIPFEVIGAEVAPPSGTTARRTVTITQKLTGSGPPLALLGGAAERTLELTIANTGTVPLDNLPVTVALGTSKQPTDVVARPKFPEIAPGDSQSVDVPITLPAPAFGTYTVKTTVSGIDQPTSSTVTTSTYPWLLLAVAILLLQIPLLGLHRRRMAADAPDDPLELAIEDLAAPPPVYGITTVRGLVDDYADPLAAERDPDPQVIVAGAGPAPAARGRRRR